MEQIETKIKQHLDNYALFNSIGDAKLADMHLTMATQLYTKLNRKGLKK